MAGSTFGALASLSTGMEKTKAVASVLVDGAESFRTGSIIVLESESADRSGAPPCLISSAASHCVTYR
eukprot:scaffold250610_cov30-Tisochrysis_lutea.AAC.13